MSASLFVGFIYQVTNTRNGKLYIGLAWRDDVDKWQVRWDEHISEGKHGRGSYFHSALRKHGADAFAWEVIDCAFSKEELDRKECEYIKRECSTDVRHGYNLMSGGGTPVPNEATCKRMSEAAQKAGSRPDIRQKRAEAAVAAHARPEVKARNSAARARPEARARHLAAMNEYWARPEERARRSVVNKEVCARPEVRAKISAAHRRPEALAHRSALMKRRWERKFISTVAWG